MPTEPIAWIEELAANAWPAAIVKVLDGWRLRFNWGTTRRANSVWPNGHGNDDSVESKLAGVEDFYARRGAFARYQISPAAQPPDLDAILAERGYTLAARTGVQVVSVAALIDHTRSDLADAVTVAEAFDEDWFAAYCQAEEVGAAAEGRRGILMRIGLRTGYALLSRRGHPIAVGLGVAERGWMGVFSLVTLPAHRRQGAATAVLHALGRWGQKHQTSQVYLQVMDDNSAARSLYERLGFTTLYHYHYREAPH